VHVKIFLDGEEEQGSPHLRSILEAHKDLLQADLWLFGDGPVHQSRRPQLYFGVRGVLGLEMTVYGPIRALHSGHYGNWAPNPAVLAAELLASMRDAEGRILIPASTPACGRSRRRKRRRSPRFRRWRASSETPWRSGVPRAASDWPTA
jgi:acetylornithine deacetylase/succinyl-diaminopimelate desuccinylase-like protein